MDRASSNPAERWALGSVSAFLLIITFILVHPSAGYPAASLNAPLSSGSWNPMVNCTPTVVTIEQILGNQTNSLGGASENGSIFNPGITSLYGPDNTPSWLTPSASTPSGWVSPGPSCSITNVQGQVVSAFVQIDGVQRSYRTEASLNTAFTQINGGTAYGTDPQSDTSFNILTPGYGSCSSTNTTACMHSLNAQIDRDWKAAGYCGTNTACDNNTLVSETAAYKSSIDVQGFLFWNPTSSNSSEHNFSGWELHPLTAWRISNTSSDYALSANPGPLPVVVGQSTSTVVSIDTFNLFTGNVSLAATISISPNSSGPVPTADLTPATVFIEAGGTGTSTLTVATSPSTNGNYTVTVTGSNGTLSRSVNVGIYVTDFGITSSPASLSVAVASSGQSTVSLSGINGFSGNVSLTAQISPSSTTGDLSPAEPTASLSSSTVSLTPGRAGTVTLTVSTSLFTLPGTYTVTVTAVSSGVTHATTVTITVTLAGVPVGGFP